MTDQYENATKKLMDYLDQTVVFAQGQLPDVAQQMLAYGAISTKFWLITFSVIAAISFLIWFIYTLGGDEDHIPGKIITGLITVFFICIAGGFYLDLMKISTAPKLYIMQEIASQVRSASCSNK